MIYVPGLRAGHNTTVGQIIICGEEFVNQAAVLDCPVGNFINLTYVNWGRTRPYSEVCDYRLGNSRTDCTPNTVITERVNGICQGRQSCQLIYSELHLWDTCVETYKYFDVRYTCMRPGNKVLESLDMRRFVPINMKHYHSLLPCGRPETLLLTWSNLHSVEVWEEISNVVPKSNGRAITCPYWN